MVTLLTSVFHVVKARGKSSSCVNVHANRGAGKGRRMDHDHTESAGGNNYAPKAASRTFVVKGVKVTCAVCGTYILLASCPCRPLGAR